MLDKWAAAFALIGLLSPMRAEACTIFEPAYASGSPEAIAAEQQAKRELAAYVAEYDLILVGKIISERKSTLGEMWMVDPLGVSPAYRTWLETAQPLNGEPLVSLSVLNGRYGSTCGRVLPVRKDQIVVVYAKERGGYWFGDFASIEILSYLEPLLH
jgi:hypothetical protein